MPHSTKTDNLSALEREKLIKPYLPEVHVPSEPEQSSTTARRKNHRRRRVVRPFVKNKLHGFLYLTIQLIFGIYIRLRQVYHSIFDRILAILYYHHRTPELIRKDVASLSRLPDHLSVILTLRLGVDDDGSAAAAIETLMDEVAELSAWCASAGIPLLSVYEKTGVLKNYMPALQTLVTQKLASYFGPPPSSPSVKVFAPNHTGSSRSPSPNPLSRSGKVTEGEEGEEQQRPPHLNLLLLSATDGRDTLVDLTRTLTEMSQAGKLRPKDITAELIDAEISATTAIPAAAAAKAGTAGRANAAAEPDLLIVFGPSVKLQGYPPWQVRLTEIFCVGDSSADVSRGYGYGYGKRGRKGGRRDGVVGARVEYQAFLRGLWRYAGAQMRFGR